MGRIIENQPKNSKTVQVVDPEEVQKADGDNVVNKHFTEILALHVKELHESHGPVEGQLQHVVPPYTALNLLQPARNIFQAQSTYHMERIVIPAVVKGPHPGLVQHTHDPVHQEDGVSNTTKYHSFILSIGP